MALVVVGHRGRPPLLERQTRLRPIERLDLGLLIDAEHHGPIRRIEIEANDLGDLLLEHRVVRDLEPLHDMRLQPGIGPDAPDARGRYAHRLRHHRAAPVRGIWAASPARSSAITFNRTSLGSGGTREGRVLSRLSPRHAFIEIPLLPPPDRRLRHARPPHDLNRPCIIGRRKDDACAPSEFARRVCGRCAELQAQRGRRGQGKGRCRCVSFADHVTAEQDWESYVRRGTLASPKCAAGVHFRAVWAAEAAVS